jgi:hypothetical protein
MIDMRSPRKPSHSHLQPGMLVKPNGYMTCTGIYADKLSVMHDIAQQYYYWSEGEVGLIVRKANRRHSVRDSLYPDVYVLINDKVVVFSSDKVAPL